MNGSIQPKNGKLYAVLSYKGENGTYKYKWVNTGLPVRGNKKKAEAMIPAREKVPSEQYMPGDRINALLLRIANKEKDNKED